mmetsp:Transcript_19/g.51  ORF Transcript_19/g.51 Transcript_19/m.51 type:complete len:507 (-) Transcript_19:314-1834(-)|eukprot:CAMPEP_0206588646 /NCGR_PEP_ID=MMETSP0325_2-20121206/38418_1 /ASSEMBLY_ACC=CAM_ASM_000347 /TAXON_ID=2866 /ORGANISM="Crypthecodinium cohnii, Strain Seligo" /LENGTH=506 /DNA_ID=CAMNT_0054096987 /DNA_START=27 /DNA_END=1547 /DNA_ORIENTATION=+
MSENVKEEGMVKEEVIEEEVIDEEVVDEEILEEEVIDEEILEAEEAEEEPEEATDVDVKLENEEGVEVDEAEEDDDEDNQPLVKVKMEEGGNQPGQSAGLLPKVKVEDSQVEGIAAKGASQVDQNDGQKKSHVLLEALRESLDGAAEVDFARRSAIDSFRSFCLDFQVTTPSQPVETSVEEIMDELSSMDSLAEDDVEDNVEGIVEEHSESLMEGILEENAGQHPKETAQEAEEEDSDEEEDESLLAPVEEVSDVRGSPPDPIAVSSPETASPDETSPDDSSSGSDDETPTLEPAVEQQQAPVPATVPSPRTPPTVATVTAATPVTTSTRGGLPQQRSRAPALRTRAMLDQKKQLQEQREKQQREFEASRRKELLFSKRFRPEAPTEYRVDNSQLNARTKGLRCRITMDLEQRHPEEALSWGSIIQGQDMGNGWFRLRSGLFAPIWVNNVQVIVPMSREEAAAKRPRKLAPWEIQAQGSLLPFSLLDALLGVGPPPSSEGSLFMNV